MAILASQKIYPDPLERLVASWATFDPTTLADSGRAKKIPLGDGTMAQGWYLDDLLPAWSQFTTAMERELLPSLPDRFRPNADSDLARLKHLLRGAQEAAGRCRTFVIEREGGVLGASVGVCDRVIHDPFWHQETRDLQMFLVERQSWGRLAMMRGAETFYDVETRVSGVGERYSYVIGHPKLFNRTVLIVLGGVFLFGLAAGVVATMAVRSAQKSR